MDDENFKERKEACFQKVLQIVETNNKNIKIHEHEIHCEYCLYVGAFEKRLDVYVHVPDIKENDHHLVVIFKVKADDGDAFCYSEGVCGNNLLCLGQEEIKAELDKYCSEILTS